MRSNFAKARKQWSISKKFKFAPRHKLLRSFEGSYETSEHYVGDDKDMYKFINTNLWDEKTKHTKYSKFGDKLTRRITHPSLREKITIAFSSHVYFPMEGPIPEDGYFFSYNEELGIGPSWYCWDSNLPTVRVLCSPDYEKLQLRISRVLEHIKKKKLFFSCKATDICRMSVTRHWDSCMSLKDETGGDEKDAGCNSYQVYHDLGNPDLAIVYTLDRSGMFSGRTIVRLIKNKKGEYCLGFQRLYGNMLKSDLTNGLSSLGIPLVELDESGDRFKSATLFRDKKVAFPYYMDITYYQKEKSNSKGIYHEYLGRQLNSSIDSTIEKEI